MSMRSIYAVMVCGLLFVSCSKTGGDKQGGNKFTYYVGLIKQGPAWTAAESPELEQLQKDHIANINRLANAGDLALAGPTESDTGNSLLRGLFFFETKTEQRARELAATDPAVKAGRFVIEVFPWQGLKSMNYDLPVTMKDYKLVLYFKGPNWTAASAPIYDSLSRWQLRELKKYDPQASSVIEGPFKKSVLAFSPSSLFVYAADSISWLQSVVDSSLPVRRGILQPMVLHWFGPAGLRE